MDHRGRKTVNGANFLSTQFRLNAYNRYRLNFASKP